LTVRAGGARATARIPLDRGVLVIGAGKGAAALAAAVESVLGDHVRGGVVIVPRGYQRRLRRIAIARGGHPLPTAASVAATARLLACVERAPGVPVIAVLTGGASALLARPAHGLTLADTQRTTDLLLRSGADIGAVNTVRKHLAAVKGGRLAERLAGRTVVGLVVSDVPGDDVAVIGSGPLTADATTAADALAVLAAHDLARRVPRPVARHLARGGAADASRSRRRSRPHVVLLAGNATARRGAVVAARAAGVTHVVALRRPLVGSTSAAARVLAARIRHVQATLARDATAVIVAGGETTVNVGASTGRGGRNQELALAVASRLAGRAGWALLCAGTDGIDGPTTAAGAYADGASLARAARVGGSVAAALRRHDVHPLLRRMRDLFSPGPTGTNVADIALAVVWKSRRWRLRRGA
jgi:glycerate-2-kinase